MDVVLDIKLNPNLRDREIRLNNGWIIKIGRGLDFYQKPGSWFEVGASDLSLRKCLETKVDIYRADSANGFLRHLRVKFPALLKSLAKIADHTATQAVCAPHTDPWRRCTGTPHTGFQESPMDGR
jgi:hypothetical protein